MLNAALVEDVPAPIEDVTYAWRAGDGGGVLMLRITSFGLPCVPETGSTLSGAPPVTSGNETADDVA